MGKMTRLDSRTIQDLKLLKGVRGGGTHADLVGELVFNELMKSFAVVSGGEFAPVGSVVCYGDDVPLIVEAVESGKVIFSNGTQIVNGGTVSYQLEVLADSISSYEGGFHNG